MLLICILCSILFLTAILSLCIVLKDIHGLNQQIHYKEQHGGQFQLSIQSNHAQMTELQENINQLYQKIHSLEEKNNAKEKEMQTLLSALTHDIRTPLTSIRGYLDLLRETKDLREQAHYLTIISDRLDALKEMLENMFLYAKMSDDDYTIKKESFLLYPLICKVLASYYQEFERQQLVLVISFADEQLKIHANYEMVYRLIQNLINNALKHGKKQLEIQEKDGILSFSNLIDPDQTIDPERLFDRFYTNDRSRHNHSSGLGLSIVKQIAQIHHWGIDAHLIEDHLFIRLHLQEQKHSGTIS